MKNYFLAFSFLFVSNFLLAQKISGSVTDAQTRMPIAFASVMIYADGKTEGTLSDHQGKFSFNQTKVDSITVSSVGYISNTFFSASIKNPLLVELKPKAQNLGEVIVSNKGNPAIPIMRQAIARKRQNSEASQNYSATVYIKNLLDASYSFSEQVPDTLKQRLLKADSSKPSFITEMVVKETKIGNKIENELIASKTSGIKNPLFNQFFYVAFPHRINFYENEITIFSVAEEGQKVSTSFVSPLDDGALKKYNFTLQERVGDGSDTVWVIDFEPKAHTKFNGLFGTVFISSKTYAITKMVTFPAPDVAMQFRFLQTYTRSGDKYFPQQLDARVRFMEMTFGKGITGVMNVLITMKTDSVNFEPTKSKGFGLQNFYINKDSIKQSATILVAQRPQNLTDHEIRSYHLIDSVMSKAKAEGFFTAIPKLAMGRLPVGMVDIDLLNVIRSNKFEKTRIGLGLITNEKISRHIELGAFAGYGFGDKQWKYGGSVKGWFSKIRDSYIQAFYTHDLATSGKLIPQPFSLKGSNSYLNNFLPAYFEYFDRMGGMVNHRFTNTITANSSFDHLSISPTYFYTWNALPMSNIKLDKIALAFQFSPGRQTMMLGDQIVNIKPGNPLLNFSFARYFNTSFKKDFSKFDFSGTYSKFFTGLGATQLSVVAGFTDKAIPYSLLYNSFGSKFKEVSFLIPNSFQTMQPNEFAASRFTNLFWIHNFGRILFDTKIPAFRPEIMVAQSVGFGDEPAANNQFINYQSLQQPFVESGIIFNNMLRKKVFGMGYFGLGIGSFYRYGFHHLPKEKDNLSIKMSLTFSVN